MREAFFNSLYVAVMSAVFAALIAVPLANFTVRFEFRGAILIQTLGVLPAGPNAAGWLTRAAAGTGEPPSR